jgi:lysophospholipase L1-like esterase
LARDEGLTYLDTSDEFKDERGFLKAEYDVGDGHHLTAEAYLKMIEILKEYGEKQ